VLRRYLFVKLKPEHTQELELVQLQSRAQEVLRTAYGVQGVHVGRAMDDTTREEWDLCITLDLVSSVDLQRCFEDAVVRAFMTKFLAQRSTRVTIATFDGPANGPRRV
jgi:hypothetical protein